MVLWKGSAADSRSGRFLTDSGNQSPVKFPLFAAVSLAPFHSRGRGLFHANLVFQPLAGWMYKKICTCFY